MSTIQHPSFTRTIDGVDGLPVEGTWDIDPGHAEVAFIGRHFMMTKVRGRFTDVTGRITIGETPADSAVDVAIGMASRRPPVRRTATTTSARRTSSTSTGSLTPRSAPRPSPGTGRAASCTAI